MMSRAASCSARAVLARASRWHAIWPLTVRLFERGIYDILNVLQVGAKMLQLVQPLCQRIDSLLVQRHILGAGWIIHVLFESFNQLQMNLSVFFQCLESLLV